MDPRKQCCFCYGTEKLTDMLPCEHRLCGDCIASVPGDIKCPSCGTGPSSNQGPGSERLSKRASASSLQQQTIPLDQQLKSLLQEVPNLQKRLQWLIAQHRKGQHTIAEEVHEKSKKVEESADMAVKNIYHRTQKLLTQVEETEEKRKKGIVSLMDDTNDNKGALQMMCLLAMKLAKDDSDDFATVALGDELTEALQLLQVKCILLDFDEDIKGLGLEFAERPQDASVGTLVRKQNCVGISTLDNGEFLLAVDQRKNGGVCLGRGKKDKTEDVQWILAFQPLDVVAPVILGSFSATKQDNKEQNIFLAVGKEVFSVNIDRLFSPSTVRSSTSVRNCRLNFLHQDARITAIDWYPANPHFVIIANDKSDVLHVVDTQTSNVIKKIQPQVNFTAANSLMTIKNDNKVQIAIASEASKKAAMLSNEGKVICYFKKPGELRPGQSPTACLPRTLFLSTVTELFILRQSKIGIMWVDENSQKGPIYVLYDADDGTWRRLFSIEDKVPVGVTYMPPGELAFCFSSARVKVAGFKD